MKKLFYYFIPIFLISNAFSMEGSWSGQSSLYEQHERVKDGINSVEISRELGKVILKEKWSGVTIFDITDGMIMQNNQAVGLLDQSRFIFDGHYPEDILSDCKLKISLVKVSESEAKFSRSTHCADFRERTVGLLRRQHPTK